MNTHEWSWKKIIHVRKVRYPLHTSGHSSEGGSPIQPRFQLGQLCFPSCCSTFWGKGSDLRQLFAAPAHTEPTRLSSFWRLRPWGTFTGSRSPPQLKATMPKPMARAYKNIWNRFLHFLPLGVAAWQSHHPLNCSQKLLFSHTAEAISRGIIYYEQELASKEPEDPSQSTGASRVSCWPKARSEERLVLTGSE